VDLVKGTTGFPVRLRYSVLGKIRFASTRDLARAFERALRIERLPLAFTQGFSPRPKMSFGLALGVAHESLAEYLDLEVVEPIELDDLPAALTAALPEGVEVTGAGALIDRAPALQEAVTAVEVRLSFAGIAEADLAGAVVMANAATTLTVTTQRKGHAVVEDLRPQMRRLEVVTDDRLGTVVEAEVATQPRGIRPADLVAALRGLAKVGTSGHGEDRVIRTHQWIERDGARLEPLEADREAPNLARTNSKGRTNDRREHTTGDDGSPAHRTIDECPQPGDTERADHGVEPFGGSILGDGRERRIA
jgi:radical SAM-linked protein